MNKILVIFIVLFLFKPIFPVVGYIINYDYIINQLCVNKNESERSCNGKCHLMNEMANATDYENSTVPQKNFKLIAENLFVEKIYSYNLTFFKTSENKNLSSFVSINYNFLHLKNCFHPPQLV